MKKAAFHLAILSFLLFATSCSKGPSNGEEPIATPVPGAAEPLAIDASSRDGDPAPAPGLLDEAPAPGVTPVAAQNPEEEAEEGLLYILDHVKGPVQVIPKGSTKAQTAQLEDSLQEGDVLVTDAGGEATLTLNEDTMVRVSENSKFQVAKLEPNASGGFTSRLQLLWGKVLSEVENLQKSRSSFEVESGGVVCGVRGTAFEVLKTGEEVQTCTFHGIVQVQGHGAAQEVKENQLSTFSLARKAFQAKREATRNHRDRYQSWLKVRSDFRERASRREELRRSASHLSRRERIELRRDLERYDRKDRERQYHQRLRKMRDGGKLPSRKEWNQESRRKEWNGRLERRNEERDPRPSTRRAEPSRERRDRGQDRGSYRKEGALDKNRSNEEPGPNPGRSQDSRTVQPPKREDPKTGSSGPSERRDDKEKTKKDVLQDLRKKFGEKQEQGHKGDPSPSRERSIGKAGKGKEPEAEGGGKKHSPKDAKDFRKLLGKKDPTGKYRKKESEPEEEGTPGAKDEASPKDGKEKGAARKDTPKGLKNFPFQRPDRSKDR